MMHSNAPRPLVNVSLVLALSACVAGPLACSRGPRAQSISPSQILESSTTYAPDAAAAVIADAATRPALPASARRDGPADPAGFAMPEIPALITDQINPGAPTTLPASRPAGTTRPSVFANTPVSEGTYLTIGGVLAEVNGQPIYANRVLRALEPVLAAKARELDPRRFQLAAADLIGKQVRDFIRDEVEFAAAQRNLEQKDIDLVEGAAIGFRKRKISQAGGSVEDARQIARDNGEDFEQLIKDEYRKLMTQLYYTRKVLPRIQVSASDIRKYYAANVSKEFTENQTAQFILIRVDPRRRGSREAALEAAQKLLARAQAGEDFLVLAASAENDDRTLQRASGKVGPIDRGAFRLVGVEEAVFALSPGQVTPIIEDTGSYYIAKLVELTGGSVRSFEEPEVQQAIREKLRAEQFRVLREDIARNLEANAAVRVNESMMLTALEMASQRYPTWRGQ
jgi:parvulin-like peptidyl-prolyl isomerase